MLAVPSRTTTDGDTEGGAPTILMEAQASGLPVISTHHADIPFVVAPEYHRFLAAENCVEDFAQKLLAMREAAARWPQLARAARQHVETLHGVNKSDRIGKLYESVQRGYSASPQIPH